MPDIHYIPANDDIGAWASAAYQSARSILDQAPKDDFDCEGTWFVGVDALPNTSGGALSDVPFPPSIHRVILDLFGDWGAFHPAQLSAVYKGYPMPRAGESETAYAYRRDRDAAHVDGILPVGREKRRFVHEPHRFILGIPLTNVAAGMSPMVYYEGSAKIMREAFQEAFANLAPQDCPHFDVTDIYHRARRTVFANCPRRVVTAQVGEAYVMDPLTLHGIAPWTSHHGNERLVAYLRPQYELDQIHQWCDLSR